MRPFLCFCVSWTFTAATVLAFGPPVDRVVDDGLHAWFVGYESELRDFRRGSLASNGIPAYWEGKRRIGDSTDLEFLREMHASLEKDVRRWKGRTLVECRPLAILRHCRLRVERLAPSGAESSESDDRAEGRRYERPETTRFYGVPLHGDRVALVIDVSSSLENRRSFENAEGFIEDPIRILDHLRPRCHQVVESMPEQMSFRIVTFHHEASAWPASGKRYVNARDENKNKARRFLDRLEPSKERRQSNTNFVAALESVFGSLADPLPARSLPDQLVLVSDGYPSIGFLRVDDLLEWVHLQNPERHVEISTVSFENPPRLMRDLAKEHGGIARYIHR